MAARRVAASSVNWAEFASKLQPSQKSSFSALKNKTDEYVRQIAALPDKLPALDWASYKAKVAVPGMVDEFQKRYESLDVNYPKDTLTSALQNETAKQKSDYEKFVSESKVRIQALQEEQAKWEAMMPVEEMNKEEALKFVPHLVVDLDKPVLWPYDQDLDEMKKKNEELKKEELKKWEY